MNIFKIKMPICEIENIDDIFKYLHIKYSIASDSVLDLKEYFEDSDEYDSNLSILSALIENNDFYNVYSLPLRKAIESFVYYARNYLKKEDPHYFEKWNSLNNLINCSSDYENIDDISYLISLNNLLDDICAIRNISFIKIKNIEKKKEYITCLSEIDLMVYSGLYLNDEEISKCLKKSHNKKIVQYGIMSIENIIKNEEYKRKRDF